jgi:transcription antitermination factor NusG
VTRYNVIAIFESQIDTHDKIEVISGSHKGKQGIVKEVFRAKNSVILEDINMVMLLCLSVPFKSICIAPSLRES